MSQFASLAINTLAFALLARLLGASVYGDFALLIFLFTLCSLLTDFGSQAFLLTKGIHKESLQIAKSTCLLSSVLGTILLGGVLAVYVAMMAPQSMPLRTSIGLILSLVFQAGMQIPRAKLVAAGRYQFLALSEILSTALSALFALMAAAAGGVGLDCLVLQLCVGAAVRSASAHVGAARTGMEGAPVFGGFSAVARGVRYGLDVMPLSLGTFLSRSLDSGLMPLVIGSLAAGTYSRSYQAVILPVAQIQLSLGPTVIARLGSYVRVDRGACVSQLLKYWRWLIHACGAWAALVAVLASPISLFLFGRSWPYGSEMLIAMSCCLPAMAASTFFAWARQVLAQGASTWIHMIVLLACPTSALLLGSLGGVEWALLGLALVGAPAQAAGLVWLHSSSLSIGASRLLVDLLAASTIPVAVLLLDLYD